MSYFNKINLGCALLGLVVIPACSSSSDAGSVSPPVDADGDGFRLEDGDCNDYDASSYPGATEWPDLIDNDCDGELDEGTVNEDKDGDGWSGSRGDCDDSDASSYPGAYDDFDGIDNDCDGEKDEQASPDRTDEPQITLGASAASVRLTHQYNAASWVADTRWVGDLDGDGYDDLTVSVFDADCQGRVYLFYGPTSALPETASMDDTANAVITGIADPNLSGVLVSSGDLDGDGYSDLLVADPYHRRVGLFYGGERLSGEIDAGAAEAVFLPVTGSYYPIGYALTSPGDIDGDGQDDLLIGQPYYDDARGRALLFYGRRYSGTVDLESADAMLLGESEADLAGGWVFSMGDFDGDGLKDFAVVATNADVPEEEYARGRIYAYYGNRNRYQGQQSLIGAWATLYAPADSGDWGIKASAGDFDGDGFDDVALGFPFDARVSGRTYLLYGRAGRMTLTAPLDQIAGTLVRPRGDGLYFGNSVSLGDLTGDGLADLIVTDPIKWDYAFEMHFEGCTPVIDVFGIYIIAGEVAVFPGSAERPSVLQVGDSGGYTIRSEDYFYIDIIPNGQIDFYDLDELMLVRPVSADGDGDGDGRADLLLSTELADTSDYYLANQAYIFPGTAF